MIIITGGHLTPALSLIEELHRRDFTDIVFIGRHIAGEETQLPAHEETVISSQGVRFIPITAGKLYRHLSAKAIISFLKIPLGLIQSWLILRRLKPQVIISFGGYLALPVSLAGKFLGIPVFTHEQGTRVGLANRLIGFLIAKKIAIAWPVNRPFFPSRKTILIGNLIRPAILKHQTKPLFTSRLTKPLLYITGGNQGSRIINQTLLQLLPQLLADFAIVHQTGLSSFNDFEILKSPHYLPYPWLDDASVSWCLHHATIVISRAGANIVTELAFTGTPAILIPLPKAQQNEQWHNANLLVTAGTARIILQTELTPERLHQEINFILQHQNQFQRHIPTAQKLVNPQAAEKLADLIYDFLRLT